MSDLAIHSFPPDMPGTSEISTPLLVQKVSTTRSPLQEEKIKSMERCPVNRGVDNVQKQPKMRTSTIENYNAR
jgi:hypothetical protein